MANGHARFAPSSAHRILLCPGSIALSENIPDQPNEYAEEGTLAHKLAEYCFEDNNDAIKHIKKMYKTSAYEAHGPIEKEMCDYVQVYLDYVRREAKGKTFLWEQRLPLKPITDEDDAFGTADAVIIDGDMLTIVDLKYGMGVEVDAEDNEQMMMYAAAAWYEYALLGNFQKFKVVIVQPRRDHINEWGFNLKQLADFAGKVREVAPRALDGTGERVPSEGACRFCKAKAVCPELAAQVKDLTAASFEDLEKMPEPDLSASMRAVGMVEDWAKAVRAEVERRLITGIKVAGYKLVQGRMGARRWTDEGRAAEEMKAVGLMDDTIYSKSLITPSATEKLLKALPDKWNMLQAFIMKKEGGPSVAPSTDPRPEIGSVAEKFEDLGEMA